MQSSRTRLTPQASLSTLFQQFAVQCGNAYGKPSAFSCFSNKDPKDNIPIYATGPFTQEEPDQDMSYRSVKECPEFIDYEQPKDKQQVLNMSIKDISLEYHALRKFGREYEDGNETTRLADPIDVGKANFIKTPFNEINPDLSKKPFGLIIACGNP